MRSKCWLNAQTHAHTCHCRNVFWLCLSSGKQGIAPGAQSTCSAKIARGLETCKIQVRRAGHIWTTGWGPAREGVGLSQRRARLEFFSGIYFPSIKGHRRGKIPNSIKAIVFSGMQIPLTLNSLMTWYQLHLQSRSSSCQQKPC